MHGEASLLDVEPRKPDPAREFVFAHRVFGAPGAYFKREDQSGEPVLCVDLGDIKATLGFDTLRRSFAIAPDTPDGRMLEAVARGLEFVRRIRPGDAIPAELLDGSASWKVEARHVATAKRRLAARLPAPLAADAAETIDMLAEELAYIEALRERVAHKRKLVETFKGLRGVHKRDRNVTGQIDGTIRLLERPVAEYENRLAAIDARTAAIAEAIGDCGGVIDQVRETRDHLHAQTMLWDDLLALWANSEPGRPSVEQRKIAESYRFAARHFPDASEWATG